MPVPGEPKDLVHNRATRRHGNRNASRITTDRQGGATRIQKSVTGEGAVADVVENQRARPVRFKRVRHHHDHRAVLVDEGGTIQALI